VLVPLGRHALAHFVPGEKISDVHGTVLIARGRTLFPMYHPAAALHAKGLRDTLFDDAKALSEALARV
jgi:DNA polymerase